MVKKFIVTQSFDSHFLYGKKISLINLHCRIFIKTDFHFKKTKIYFKWYESIIILAVLVHFKCSGAISFRTIYCMRFLDCVFNYFWSIMKKQLFTLILFP
jgi:hypothetical protein